MAIQMREYRNPNNSNLPLRVAKGHFATSHSHINYYVDLTMNIDKFGYNFIESVFSGFGTALGYTIAIVLLAGIRSRVDETSIPRPVRGAPIVMLAAALMSIAFMGFAELQPVIEVALKGVGQ